MNTDNIIIHHKGFFNYNLLNKLLTDFIKYVDENKIDNFFFKKIQIIMVEMLENNYQYIHSIEDENRIKDYKPEFKILKTDGEFKIISSNPVLHIDADILKSHIDKINSSDLEELKELYKLTLKEGMHSEKRTAGTGLIRIAKVTKNKISYSFRKIDNKFLYYTLEIVVNSK